MYKVISNSIIFSFLIQFYKRLQVCIHIYFSIDNCTDSRNSNGNFLIRNNNNNNKFQNNIKRFHKLYRSIFTVNYINI